MQIFTKGHTRVGNRLYENVDFDGLRLTLRQENDRRNIRMPLDFCQIWILTNLPGVQKKRTNLQDPYLLFKI